MRTEYPIGSPERYAEDLYWQISEFENLNTDEVKKMCNLFLQRLMTDGDTAMRLYYSEARNHIKQRGELKK